MILDMVCPNIAELGLRARKGHKPVNFNKARCIERLRLASFLHGKIKENPCWRCPTGTHYFIEEMMR